MGLFPKAPEIAVRLHGPVRAGQHNEIEISLTARESVDLEFVDATLEIVESWALQHELEEARSETLLALSARLLGRGTLERGAHSFRRSFELPSTIPPTFELRWAKVECRLTIHASIPWWPDSRAAFLIPVRAATRDVPVAPYLLTNGATGGSVPRIEVSLASRHIAARGVLAGAIAIFHHKREAVTGTRLALRARTALRRRVGGAFEREAVAYTIALPSSLPVDGTPVPFRFQLPDEVAPSLRSMALELDWQLLVERPLAFGTDVWLEAPITILESEALEAATRAIEAPRIGDERLSAVLADVAHRTGFRVEGSALISEERGTRIAIVREQRAAGSVLIATIDLPARGLGLGLIVERARPLARLLEGDVEIGHPRFDAEHRIEAREAAQARALFSAGLVDAIPRGALVRLDDQRAILEQLDPTLDGAALARFARAAAGVAWALEAAIARVPPPGGIELDQAACAEVECVLASRWRLADLSIVGHLGASEVAISARFDRARPIALALRVRPSPELPASLELRARSPRAEANAILESHGAALAAVSAALPQTARAFEIAGGFASLELPFDRRPDVRAALEAAQALASLAASLAPQRGPFR